MNMPLHHLSLQELHEAYRTRDRSPVEVTKITLERIESLNSKMNAFIHVTREMASDAARVAEEEIRNGVLRGPLQGVPVAVKDLFNVKGVPTTGGSVARKNFFPEEDATVVARLRDAGAVLLGKLAMTEGAFVEHVSGMPEPLNPWNEKYSTGLSSSGPAVALAAGMCWGALGSDTGGSIRFPAIACGVTGLKPTRGRVSCSGVMPLASSLDHVGPMARTVEDVAAVLSVVAGRDSKDLTTHPNRVPDYQSTISLGVEGLRLGFDVQYCSHEVDKDLSKALIKSLDIFANCGMQICPINMPPTDLITPNFTDLVSAEAAVAHGDSMLANEDKLGLIYRNLLHRGRDLPAVRYIRLSEAGRQFSGALNCIFDDVDIIICPPWPTPALPKSVNPVGDLDAQGNLLRFTAPYNISGSPSLTIPCGFNHDGLPLALQIVGRFFQEDVLLRAGYAYQQHTGWHKKHPIF